MFNNIFEFGNKSFSFSNFDFNNDNIWRFFWRMYFEFFPFLYHVVLPHRIAETFIKIIFNFKIIIIQVSPTADTKLFIVQDI